MDSERTQDALQKESNPPRDLEVDVVVTRMFRKSHKSQSQTLLRGSEKKRFRALLLQVFPRLTEESLNTLIDPKDDIACQRIQTNSGTFFVYLVQNEPLFIDINLGGDIYPTLYALWKVPNMVNTITIHPPVFQILQRGADLMLPGVRLPPGGISELGPLKVGERRAIVTSAHPFAVAVGSLLVGDDYLRRNGMKGKAVKIVHTFKDHIWKSGSKFNPFNAAGEGEAQDSEDSESDEENEDDEEEELEMEETPQRISAASPSAHTWASIVANTANAQSQKEQDIPDSWDDGVESTEAVAKVTKKVQKMKVAEKKSAKAAESSQSVHTTVVAADEKSDSDDGDDDTAADSVSQVSAAEMDALLERSLFQALKTLVTDKDLPILVSNLYSNYILPSRPANTLIDVKKSSHKKISQFLKSMEKRGILKIKDVRGVQQLSSVNRKHPDLVQFKEDKNIEKSEEAAQTSSSSSTTEDVPDLIIQEFYQPPQQITSVFPTASSKAVYTKEEIRTILLQYIQREKLVLPSNPQQMRLNARLAQFLKLGEGDAVIIEDTSRKFFEKMSIVYMLSRGDEDPVYSKGELPKIELIAENRTGKKHVTRIIGVEQFLLDPEQLALEFRTSFASSTSVTPVPGKGAGMEVMVQGNIIKELIPAFVKKYKVPKNCITSTDKTKGKSK